MWAAAGNSICACAMLGAPVQVLVLVLGLVLVVSLLLVRLELKLDSGHPTQVADSVGFALLLSAGPGATMASLVTVELGNDAKERRELLTLSLFAPTEMVVSLAGVEISERVAVLAPDEAAGFFRLSRPGKGEKKMNRVSEANTGSGDKYSHRFSSIA